MQGARGNRDGSYSIIHNTISQGNIGFIDQHSLSLDRSFYEVGRKDILSALEVQCKELEEH